MTDSYLYQAEMTEIEHQFIKDLISAGQPRKILEVGVSAGGTTAMLLQCLPREAALYSVDIAAKIYRDRTKPIGFLADQVYDAQAHPKWVKYLGVDLCQCLEQIGGQIDFVILDTVHKLPGEFLSFLAVLPYLSEHSTLLLHDISLHVSDGNSKWSKNSYCTSLLYSSIASHKKTLAPDPGYPNLGALEIDRKYVMDNIYMVFNTLSLPWPWIPPAWLINEYKIYLPKHYPPNFVEMFNVAVMNNLDLRNYVPKENAGFWKRLFCNCKRKYKKWG